MVFGGGRIFHKCAQTETKNCRRCNFLYNSYIFATQRSVQNFFQHNLSEIIIKQNMNDAEFTGGLKNISPKYSIIILLIPKTRLKICTLLYF